MTNIPNTPPESEALDKSEIVGTFTYRWGATEGEVFENLISGVMSLNDHLQDFGEWALDLWKENYQEGGQVQMSTADAVHRIQSSIELFRRLEHKFDGVVDEALV